MEACELLSVEARLDRIDAELASELAPHMRRFARAYASGAALPPAPEVLRRETALAAARAALAHPLLADRGLALVRLAAPIAIDADPRVTAAYAAPATWEALAALAVARDAAAMARFGARAVELLHRLHGSARVAPVDVALPPTVAGWMAPDGIALDDRTIARRWDAIQGEHGIAGSVAIERSAAARPRAFVVEPGREVIVVVPAELTTPALRFAVLHELGHALAALALPPGIPRLLDEAAAAYVARGIERPSCSWHSPAAKPARLRRRALAARLDRLERALPSVAERIAERPPWALWHDPGAQAAYVGAEAVADRLERELGASPRPGALASALAAERAELDRLGAALA